MTRFMNEKRPNNFIARERPLIDDSFIPFTIENLPNKKYNNMAKSIINCACSIEFDSLAEYEALDEVYKMLNKKHPIGNKISLIIKDIVASSSEGCAITYPKSE